MQIYGLVHPGVVVDKSHPRFDTKMLSKKVWLTVPVKVIAAPTYV